MVIGLTGGSGCGKTTALDELRALGAFPLDADAVYHELLLSDREMLDEIGAAFPGSVEDGVLQRRRLGAYVFGNPDELKKLNAITHPRVKREIRARIRAEKGRPLFVIDAFGLMEGGLDRLCDHTVAVLAPREARIERLMRRDGISMEYAARRIDAQKSDRDFSESCEFTLYNSGSEEEFRQDCRAFFTALIEKEIKE